MDDVELCCQEATHNRKGREELVWFAPHVWETTDTSSHTYVSFVSDDDDLPVCTICHVQYITPLITITCVLQHYVRLTHTQRNQHTVTTHLASTTDSTGAHLPPCVSPGSQPTPPLPS